MHPEAIESKRKKVFQKLKSFPEFCLVGGTALALQIGHRISVDFDLFSEKDIPRDFLDKIEKVFKNFKIGVEINNPEQLTVKINKTRIDFVKHPFPLASSFTKFQGINILGIPDIAAMKAYSMGRRPSLKDYIDLYFILKKKYLDLKKIINIAGEKYKDEFNSRLFLEQIVYLRDVKPIRIKFLKERITKKEMEKFFEKKVKEIKI